MNHISGIYQITSTIRPGRMYIGSAINIRKRWGVHKSMLLSHRHHSKKLQRHVDKYGLDDLVFMVITECDEHNLIKEEQKYIDSLHPYFNGNPTAGSNLGMKMSYASRIKLMGKRSEATKQKMRDSHPDKSGSNNPMYGKLGPDHPSYGRPVSDETRKNLSKALKGKIKSVSHRMNTSESWKNREVCRCIYCGLETRNKTNITRWHNNKCKLKPYDSVQDRP